MGGELLYAFRITHIRNIERIAETGIVRANSPLRDPNYVNIGDPSIIQKRGNRIVKGYKLDDFIPFYFGPRSPMLYVIQHGYNNVKLVHPDEIVYCVIRIKDVIQNNIESVFTDGHALSGITNFYTREKLAIVNDIINYDDVYSSQWDSETDIDLKRRKEAELLVKEDLPPKMICGFVVYNVRAKQYLLDRGLDESKIVVKSQYYF